MTLADILDQIEELPPDWHGAGTMNIDTLRAIAEICRERPIQSSLETGAGKSTLLFSWMSERHLVFAMDVLESLSAVRKSPLLRSDHVEIIEGPTQSTLPQHHFNGLKLDAALIDGPHGYPFPDLEYFFIYPLLETGAMLIVDDIKIPTIQRMVEIIRNDAMFEFVDVVGKTAFLRRTSTPVFDPYGDGWWDQAYNRSYFVRVIRTGRLKERVPPSVIRGLPAPVRRFLRRHV